MRPRAPGKYRSWSPEYTVWWNMIERCHGKRSTDRHASYRRKGITVCDRWRQSFDNFLEDVGHKPFPRAQLDRVDNDGNYEPGNVRWTTVSENRRNRPDVRILEHNGVRKPASAWAEDLGLDVRVLCKRLERGWSVERAVTTRKAR